ncbi:MAG: Co2+/Mg2+ efflux protein ApaG [Arenicella sp.]
MSAKILIEVQSKYLEKQSEPEENRFVFAYTITITNYEEEAIQLISRHWIIKDANNKLEEIVGEGVVGEQPVIEPQQRYQYSSGAILDTEVGTMEGYYQMRYKNDDMKKAKIPKFTLSVPRMIH